MPTHPNHTDIVVNIKNQLVAAGEDLSSPNDSTPCNPFKITSRVAWLLRSEGIGLVKKGGNNCKGYSTDALMYQDGQVYDILGASGELNTPQWNDAGIRPPSDWAPPFDPGNIIIEPPQPPNTELEKRVKALEDKIIAVEQRAINADQNSESALNQSNAALNKVDSFEDKLVVLENKVKELEKRIPTGVQASAKLFGYNIPISAKLTY